MGLSVMLGLLAINIFVVSPLVARETLASTWFEVFFAGLLLSGVAALPRGPVLTPAAFSLITLTLLLRWGAGGSSSVALMVVEHLLTIASFALLSALILAQVFRDGPITGHRIQGAIAVYLLLGLTWTSAYNLVYQSMPGAFRFADAADAASKHVHDLLYYSFVTLTTMGYGDIVPAHPVARSLATAEALVGQLYPAILIGRLVSMQIDSRRRA
jgi:Ion channel